jgi:hypothetical protein
MALGHRDSPLNRVVQLAGFQVARRREQRPLHESAQIGGRLWWCQLSNRFVDHV